MPTDINVLQQLLKLQQQAQEIEARQLAREERDALRESGSSGQVQLPGQSRDQIHVGNMTDQHEKLCAGLDGFWSGTDQSTKGGVKVPRFTSFQESYVTCTRQPWDPIACMEALHVKYDSHGRYGQRAAHFTEALQTSSWGQILGDSVTRRMLGEYYQPNRQTWRSIVSDIGTISDFRLQRRLRFGGYGVLPTVLEGVPYTALQSPTDQEAQYAVVKKGGLESVTLESLTNDAATGAIRRIPQRLGRAAAETLYRAVFDLFDLNLPLTWDDDTTPLFSAGHANLITPATALNVANLDTLIQLMSAQTAYGNSVEILGLKPKYLVHPTALWRAAAQLTQSQGEPYTGDNQQNVFRQFRIQTIEVPYWTARPTAFYLVCDPTECPTIEVGFLKGREDPEIFVSDSDSIEGSSMWNADRLSWKIRHIWGVGVTEYRGMVGNR
jgi:hypothetical protein